MALPAVGSTISMSQIQTEYGGSNPASLSEYYGKGNAPGSGAITMSADFGGTSAETLISSSVQQMTVSSYISSGETMRIGSGVYIWSDSTSTAGMIINIPCTIINDGYIIGKGGGNSGAFGGPNDGGPAISVTSSGVTIINNSGAFIAGGGGEGGRGRNGTGGGGAGGGQGGSSGGAGGAIGQAGSAGSGTGSGSGGGAGGGGAATTFNGSGKGGGGGRILPGTGGAGGPTNFGGAANGGTGGSAGNNGGNAPNNGNDLGSNGGGGGWGAPGGVGYYPTSSARPGGAGGAAITGTSRTLTNNGTVYGST